MGLFYMAFIDRIKYDASTDDAVVWKYGGEEVRLGAQLIVNDSQEAVFFKGGKALDTFGPGTHTLSSDNVPLLRRLVNLPFGGKTPFTAEVYFVNKIAKRDLRWGTAGPIQVLDPVYRFPVSVRAFGRWGMRVDDARSFLVQLIGTQTSSSNQGYIGSERIERYFTGEVIQRLSDELAKFFTDKGLSVLHASAHINDLSSFIEGTLASEFGRFGIEVTNFNVERVSIPEDEQRRLQDVLAKRMEIDQVSQAKVGKSYTVMRSFDALDKAADNEGGGAGQLLGAGFGLGTGLGAGVPIGQQVGAALNVDSGHRQAEDPVGKLNRLKQMLEGGLITQSDYDNKKQQILDSL